MSTQESAISDGNIESCRCCGSRDILLQKEGEQIGGLCKGCNNRCITHKTNLSSRAYWNHKQTKLRPMVLTYCSKEQVKVVKWSAQGLPDEWEIRSPKERRGRLSNKEFHKKYELVQPAQIMKSMLMTYLPEMKSDGNGVNMVLAWKKDVEPDMPSWVVVNVAHYLSNPDYYEGWLELDDE